MKYKNLLLFSFALFANGLFTFGNNHSTHQAVNFVPAASISTPCVVHIKTIQTTKTQSRDPFQDLFGPNYQQFFGNPYQQQQTQKHESSGSGVIVSSDGYIVTNNHVIQDADEIEVILNNKKSYKAKLIGVDKDTDLGLIKINEENLQSIGFANSDSVQVGEWVLAVGNPFNLASTVTGGIVSAKGRSINILNNQRSNGTNSAIESFIQTDAAVNPGNSGGALVDIRGQLIGINTAIASPTGAYAGYAFAVPSNIVKKVINDIRSYGLVQRAYLGVNMASVNEDIAKALSLKNLDGVYVENVVVGGAAETALLMKKDVITKINNVVVNTGNELQEQIAKYHPGEKIELTYIRNGKEMHSSAILKNQAGTTSIIKQEQNTGLDKLGLELQALTPNEAQMMGLSGGLRVMKIKEGVIKNYTDLKPGFVITSIKDKAVKSTEQFKAELNTISSGTVVIEGVYPNRPFTFQYAFKI
jgi:serine protease Do